MSRSSSSRASPSHASKHVLALALVLLAACRGAARSPERPKEEEATWLQTVVTESARTLDNRCVDFAPLEIVFTDDPRFYQCMSLARSAADAARKEVYWPALEACVAKARQGGHQSCCFSKVGDDFAANESMQIECDAECRSKAGRELDWPLAPSRQCKPMLVTSLRPSRSRAYSAAVERVVAGCRLDDAQKTRCEALPSWGEQMYCKGKCDVEAARFYDDVTGCVLRVLDGQALHCNGVTSSARAECEARCRVRASTARGARDATWD